MWIDRTMLPVTRTTTAGVPNWIMSPLPMFAPMTPAVTTRPVSTTITPTRVIAKIGGHQRPSCGLASQR